MKYVAPSVNMTAFNCPHCGALAKQFWAALQTSRNKEKLPLPLVVPPDDARDFKNVADADQRKKILATVARLRTGSPFTETSEETLYGDRTLYNVNVSECFNCEEVSIWIYDRLVYPMKGEAHPPNADLPEDIRRDYLEASSILNLSPRGAAALIRLSIQKLCKHLGQSGENINSDIKALVAAGLDARVQKALDAVRVIGNNAVHPGKIDFTDDRATAESLFHLLNLIAEKTISEPKHVDEVYAGLPEHLRKAIEDRDRKKD